jgi:peptidoglycan/LPS O-acetylase OafA/YrhL
MSGWFIRWSGVQKYDLFLTIGFVVFPVVMAVSALSYYAVEKPFLGMRVRYTTARHSAL